ncbi:hypothetical protein G6F40_014117 [Rhizopus arrhizus]|nr:hypothetical protein G6F40_014117 [Rhizopus arrhizus]
MKVWKAPPGRRSNARTSVVHGFGHHHWRSSSGSVQARQSAARGAFNKRLMTRSVSGLLPASTAMGLLLSVKGFNKRDHAVGARFPHGALRGQPLLGLLQPRRHQFAGTYAPLLVAAHDAAAFQHGQVLHQRRQRHLERLGPHRHRARPLPQRGYDRATGGVGQRVEDFLNGGIILTHMAK